MGARRVPEGDALRPPRADVLRAFEILRDLTDAERELLFQHTSPVNLAPGEYLFREGDPGDALYLLWEGTVVAERSLAVEGERTKSLALLPAFSFVGEMALADDGVRSASVRAEIPIRALRLARADFDKLMWESPPIASKLFRALFAETSRRLRSTDEELIAVYEVGRIIASGSEPQKIAEAVMAGLAARLDASYLLVTLYDASTNALRIAGVSGAEAVALVGRTIPLDHGLAARAYDERKPMLIERLLGATEPWESESMLLAPLLARNASVGLLVAGVRRSGAAYRMSDLSLAAAVANISAATLREAFEG